MRIDSREQHYLEAKRRLDLASGRVASLDAQIMDIAGTIASWRANWQRTRDPDAAVAQVLNQPWPGQDDVERTFEEWLEAYHAAIEAWSALSGDAQLRVAPPTGSSPRALP